MSPRRLPLALTALAAAAITLGGCFNRVEGTGRTQLMLTSEADEAKLGANAYKEILSAEKPSDDPVGKAFIERVGKRLAAVAPDKGFQYEFTLIDSPTVNAFCLPGGKVAIYTGILPYCENEAGLAAVMGHEIAHAIARHGGERMSQEVLAGNLQQALGAYLEGAGTNPFITKTGMAAFGAGSQIGVLLPFSRKHETEADELGIDYMARAGYDPREAVKFWQRFATLGGGGTPSWLSTHPASEDRVRDLQKQLPGAEKLYQAAPQKFGAGEPVPARYRAKAAAKP